MTLNDPVNLTSTFEMIPNDKECHRMSMSVFPLNPKP